MVNFTVEMVFDLRLVQNHLKSGIRHDKDVVFV